MGLFNKKVLILLQLPLFVRPFSVPDLHCTWVLRSVKETVTVNGLDIFKSLLIPPWKISDSGLCCNLSLSITAERELFLDRKGDLLGFPEGQDIEPSADNIPATLPLVLQFSESFSVNKRWSTENET